MLTANSLKSDSWLTCALSIMGSGCWYLAARSMRMQSKASWLALPVLSGSELAHDAAESFEPASIPTADPPAPDRASTAASAPGPPDEPPAPDAPLPPPFCAPEAPLDEPEAPFVPPVDEPPAPLTDELPPWPLPVVPAPPLGPAPES